MYPRLLKKPSKSFLLFGPRGTGKSTWLRNQKFDLTIDLLNTQTRLSLQRDPHQLVHLTKNLKPKSWVAIDEVQKIPDLLDEVHALYEEQRFHFALSGSSARKLKRSKANLLAGRAITTSMYPLVRAEFGNHIHLSDRVEWGTLPLTVSNFENRAQTLDSYLDNYLRQELIEEGIIRQLDPFIRFLQIAGIMNAQILNVENISRDCKVKRPTVDKYFQVLEDTLIGYKLPAYQPGIKTKEVNHPKFYFFDTGVCRAAAGHNHEELDPIQKGFYFETYVINEIRAWNDYLSKKLPIFYYSVSGGEEIDLILRTRSKTVSRQDQNIAIEIKYAKNWDSRWTKTLESFQRQMGKRVERIIGIYAGDKKLSLGNVTVYPIDFFLDELYKGNIL